MKKIYASFILATAFMLVMSLGVLAATCPSGTTPTHVETVTVPSDGSSVTSTNVLESGVTYLLEASGTANAGDTIDFDAKYSITNRILEDTWTDIVSGYESHGANLLDLKVNNDFVDWGTYNDGHIYWLSVMGSGTPVTLQIYDIYYPNNVGSLTVDIDKCVDITPPEITFEQPLDGSIHSGVINLKAECDEVCDYINFWWRAEDEPFAWYRYHYVHTDGTVFDWGLNTLDAQLANGTSYLMEDGTYYLYAAGKDLAGNWARTPEIMVIVDQDEDGILGDDDKCQGTVADVPEKRLGTNRWIWDGSNWKTKDSNGVGPQKSFSMEDTQGCSCNQILDEMGDGKKTGHRKFGCSISVMEDFIASIQPPIFVDTVEVPSDGSTVSSVSLDDGVEYLLEASGTYRFANWGPYGIADAEWAYRNDAYKDDPLPVHGWTLGELTYPSVLGLDVLVDGGNVYWGDYNDAHTYVSPYTGNGNPVSFDIYDSAYGDNSGFITVDIYKLP